MKIRLTLAILLGWLLLGPVAPASAATGDVPPRPLTEQGLTNLTALTRLIGYVRFFHPSDQVAGLANADWDALAMAGIERVEGARNPRELADALSGLFAGKATADGLDVTGQMINPDMEEVVSGFPPRGWLLNATPFGAEYSLSPVTGAAAGHWAAELSGPHVRPVSLPLVEDLGGGVSAVVPVALPANDQGTFPHLPQPPVPDKPAGFVPNDADRTTGSPGWW